MLCCCLQFIKGDLQSGDLLSYILETEKIDTVMHFAAQVRLHCQAQEETRLTGLIRLKCMAANVVPGVYDTSCSHHCTSGRLKQARQA